MNSETNWLPGIIVLAVAAVGALIYLFTARRPPEGASTGANDDLTTRYNVILEQLRTHLANKHLQPADTWEAERRRLELAAAAVLRERDGLAHDAQKAAARAERLASAPAGGTLFTAYPQLKPVLIGAAVVLFFGLLGLQLTQSTKPRADGMSATGMQPPGGMPAGEPPPGGGMEEPAREDPKLRELSEAVQKAPDDLEKLGALSISLMHAQQFDQARPFVMHASALDPYDVKVRVARQVLRAVDGDMAGAMADLQRLADMYPEAYDARLFVGLIAMDQNDSARALKSFEWYLSTAPAEEQPPMLPMAVAQLRQQVEQGTPPPKSP